MQLTAPSWTAVRSFDDVHKGVELGVLATNNDCVSKLKIDRAEVIEGLKNYADTAASIDATEEWLDISMPQWHEDTELDTVREARRRIAASSEES